MSHLKRICSPRVLSLVLIVFSLPVFWSGSVSAGLWDDLVKKAEKAVTDTVDDSVNEALEGNAEPQKPQEPVQEASAAAATVPATQKPTSAGAKTTAAPVGQESTYARRSAFTDGAQTLAAYDNAIEKCQGKREDYRSRFETLVSAAHPEYRAEAMSRYDSQYSGHKQMNPAFAGSSTFFGPCSNLETFKSVANGILDRLGANCAAASQCAEMSTQTSVPSTGGSSSSQVATASATGAAGAVTASGDSSDAAIGEREADVAAAVSGEPTSYLVSYLPKTPVNKQGLCDYEIRQDRLSAICADSRLKEFEFSIKDIDWVRLGAPTVFHCRDNKNCSKMLDDSGTAHRDRTILHFNRMDWGKGDYLNSLKIAIEAWAASEGASVDVQCQFSC